MYLRSYVLLVCLAVGSVAASARAGGSVYVDSGGDPTEPPKIVADWSEVEVEGSVDETYDGATVQATVGYYLCDTTFLPAFQEDDGHYVWSKSLNWNSVAVPVLHVKRVHTIITNPGEWVDLMDGDTSEECGLADITQAGPTAQIGSVDIDDLPVVPEGVSVALGTNFRFNVTIDAPEELRMNQYADVEHLAVANSQTKLINCYGDTFIVRNGLQNAGTIEGNFCQGPVPLFVSVSGGIDNTGLIQGNLGSVSGGVVNSLNGEIHCYGDEINGFIDNDGELWIERDTVLDAPQIRGAGWVHAMDDVTLANSADPANGCVLRQDLTSQSALLSAHPIQTADGATISAAGRMDCVLDGDLRVTPGQTLIVWGGRTTQYGRIDVPSDATLRTWDQAFAFHNAGTISVDGRLLMPAPPRDMDLFDGRVTNDGQIIIRNGGILEMPKVRYTSVYKSAVLDGAGLLRVEQGGELLNPRTAGEQTIELAFGATATFDSHCIDNFDRYYNTLVGTIHNAGRIQVADGANGLIGGTLVNDNEIRVLGGELVIDVPEVSGSGDIVFDGTLEFRNSAQADSPPVLKQPVSGQGYLIARDGLAAEGAGVTMHGYFRGNLGCELDVATGQTLYYGDLNHDRDEILAGGVVRAFGTDTRMHLNKLTNKGLIEAGDGGVLWTYDHELTNEGTIHVQDGGTLEIRRNTYGGVSLFRNTGTIRIDGGEMLFKQNKYVAGAGEIVAENGGTITNPQIRIIPHDTEPDELISVTVNADSKIQVTADVKDTCNLRGAIDNAGEITIAERTYIAGTLNNDGLIHMTGGYLNLNLPRIEGDGTITMDSGTIEFRNTTDPDAMPVLAQSFSGSGTIIASDGIGSDGGSMTFDGYFRGDLGCELDVTAGQTLYYGDLNHDRDEILAGGVVRAFGTDTRMHLNKLTNKGLIEAGDGGVLWTYDHELTNEGTIHVKDGGTLKVRLNRFADDHHLFTNHGTIRVDGGLLEFRGGRRYIGGTGEIVVENGGVVRDPQVRPWDSGSYTAQTAMTVDATGRIECSQSSTSRICDLTQHGHLQLASSARLGVFGDWIMEPTASVDTGEGTGRRYVTLHGDWINRISDPANFDLHDTVVRFCAGTGDDPLLLEVASSDLGDGDAGWDGGFCLESLEIMEDSHVKLVNGHDNGAVFLVAAAGDGNSSEGEALYVEHLMIQGGATLDVGNLNLYYKHLNGDPDRIIPEPATVTLLACGLAIPALRRRRRTG